MSYRLRKKSLPREVHRVAADCASSRVKGSDSQIRSIRQFRRRSMGKVAQEKVTPRIWSSCPVKGAHGKLRRCRDQPPSDAPVWTGIRKRDVYHVLKARKSHYPKIE